MMTPKCFRRKRLDQLEQQLKAYEDSTSNQISILIVPSLGGDAIEEYALRVAEKWKLGTKKKDNGALLLIAIDDHKMRIEVGEGLEGVLTDAQSNRIIRNEMAPDFRRGDYDGGVTSAVHAMIKTIAGEYKADDLASSGGEELTVTQKILMGMFILTILGIFTAIALFSPGGTGWGLYSFLIPFYAIFPWLAIGLTGGIILFGLYVVGMPLAKIIVGRSAWGKSKMIQWQSRGGSFSSGSSIGGSSWGSSTGNSFGGGGWRFFRRRWKLWRRRQQWLMVTR